MENRSIQQVDHLLARDDKTEMMAPLSRLAIVDDCFGIGGVWFASAREFHASEGFPAKAEIRLFLPSGEPFKETQRTHGWFPSVSWHRRVFGRGKLIVRELKFISGEAVFDVLEFINHSKEDLNIKLVLRGRASAAGTVSFRDGRIHIDEDHGRTLSGTYAVIATEPRLLSCRLDPNDMELAAQFAEGPRELSGDRIRYLASADLLIPADGRIKGAIAVAWEFSKHHALSQLPKKLADADSVLPQLKKEWNDFWEGSIPKLQVPDKAFEKLYYYSWYVTRAQTMPSQGRLRHSYVAPSKFAHVGAWLQDQSYAAIGSRWLNSTGLSQNSIKLLMNNQFANGFIPSSVNASGIRVYDRDTGHPLTLDLRNMGKRSPQEIPSQIPPVFTVAANEVFLKTGNMDFLKECYQAARKLDDWMTGEREDESGLFTAVHPMEVENCAGSRRMEGYDHIKAVDVSALNVHHRRLLISWASILGETRRIDVLKDRMERTAKGVMERCRNNERGFYYDLLPNGDLSPVETAAGFYAMYAMEPPAREEPSPSGFLEALLDPKRFWTPVPVPTVSVASGGSGQGVSQSVDWFVIKALISHGYKEQAEKIVRKLIQAHLPEGQPDSREGYDPRTGDGRGAPDFAWVTLITDLLMTSIMGIHPQRMGLHIEPWLPLSWEHASVKGFRLGPHMVDLSYDIGQTASTVRIRPVAVEKGNPMMPVILWWRTQPGEKIIGSTPEGEVYNTTEFKGREAVRIALHCPVNAQTVVYIRTKKGSM